MADPDRFDALIIPWLMNRNKWEIAAEAQELRLAFTPVLSAGELLEDQQLKARGFFDTARHPRLGKMISPGSPAKLSRTPWLSGSAPLLGEHNGEIYRKHGYTQKELNKLRKAGII
jgi:formyl-CoA transferase